MENQTESVKLNTGEQAALTNQHPAGTNEQRKSGSTDYQERKKELHSKILEITLLINDQYPELAKYLEEMQDTIPDEENPEIILLNLKSYYDSLCAIMNKYKEDHSPEIH